MNTGLRDFLIKYKEKLANDKDIKENQLDFTSDTRERISFNVSVSSTCPNRYFSLRDNRENLFRLDDEDLEYLYHKYSKRIKSEMEQNIEKVRDSYKDAL